jgi:acetylglutamate kinase
LDDLLRLAREGNRVVVVHGGGNAINGLLKKWGEEPRFHNGLRVTDAAALDAALMMMRGQINAELVTSINRAGAPDVQALGLCGVDGRLLECRKDTAHGDLGFVGEIVKVNPGILESLLQAGMMPLIAPFGFSLDEDARIFNINADNVTAHVAAALQAQVCIFLTDVAGVLDAEKQLIPDMTPRKAQELIKSGVIGGGMIPKIEAALKALEGSQRVIILDGRRPNALYEAVAGTQTAGTTFTQD